MRNRETVLYGCDDRPALAPFFGANLIKIEYGGWFPLLVAGIVYGVMSTWKRGRELVVERLHAAEVPLDAFFRRIKDNPPVRVRARPCS